MRGFRNSGVKNCIFVSTHSGSFFFFLRWMAHTHTHLPPEKVRMIFFLPLTFFLPTPFEQNEWGSQKRREGETGINNRKNGKRRGRIEKGHGYHMMMAVNKDTQRRCFSFDRVNFIPADEKKNSGKIWFCYDSNEVMSEWKTTD